MMNVRASLRLLLSVIAFGLCLVIVGPIAHAQETAATSSFGVDVERVVSPGGIEAWLVSDDTVPMMTLRAYWRGGSAHEPESLTGATSIMTDMLTEGAGDYDAGAFKERMEELNGSVGFGADWDGVSMSVTTLSANRDAVFEMARLALHEPRFDADPLARIKRQIAVGIRQRETDANFIANNALNDALIPGHPYGRFVTMEHVARIDVDVLRAYWRSLYTWDDIAVTVVGDIDAVSLGVLLDALFAGLPEGDAQPETPEAVIGEPVGLIIKELPQPQSRIVFVAPGIQDEDPDWIALSVANYILGGGGFSSRLMDEVREKRGLVYGIGTGPSVSDALALYRGSASTENGDVVEAIGVIREQLALIYGNGVTQQEVDDAISYLTGSYPLSLDSNLNIAGALHAYHVNGWGIDYVNRRNALISAVTLEDVNRVIRRVIKPEAFTFVVVGQPEGLDEGEETDID